MPSKARGIIREERKARVVALFAGGEHLTAREIALRCGWPVNRISAVLRVLLAERRLRAVGSQVVIYAKRCPMRRGDTTLKEVNVYAAPMRTDVSGFPAWLRGPAR